MVTRKKATPKKPKQLTLFFETQDACQIACDRLGLSPRKVTNIDRNHGGSYSKATGHYGFRFERGNCVRVSLRFKLIVDEPVIADLSAAELQSLGHLDITSLGWIAP